MKNGWLFCWLIFSSLLIGCGEEERGPRTVPAVGVLTLDGAPVEVAAIVLIGDDGVNSAQALSDSSGGFSLDAFEYKTGAVPGAYKAVITKTVRVEAEQKVKMSSEEAEHAGDAAGMVVKNSLPKKYETPSQELSFVIPDEGTRELNIALTSK